MAAAFPSPQPRSSRKRIGTREWKSGTPYIRNTAWRATRATARPTISKPFANMAHRRSTAIPSLRCGNPLVGLLARRKLLLTGQDKIAVEHFLSLAEGHRESA